MPRFSVHNHTEMSNFRLLDCIIKLPDLIKRGKEIGLAGLAVTDHETIAQSIRICKLQKENPDFKIAIGNEIYLTDSRDKGQKYPHYILIAKDKEGHKQLRRLSTRAWLNSYWDRGIERVPTLKSELEEEISKNPGHLIATSACIGGELGSSILDLTTARTIGDSKKEIASYNKIISFIEFNKRLFNDDFYFEIAPAASKDQIIVNKMINKLSSLYNIPIVIGDDSHYLKKEDRYIHKAYLNSKGGERETDLFYEYSYLQDENDIRKNLEPSEIDVDSCFKNSMEIFDKIEVYDLLHSQTIPSVPVEYYIINHTNEDFHNKYPNLASLYESEDIYDRYWVNECIAKMVENNFNTKENYIKELEEEARVKRIIGEKLGTNMFKYPITLKYYIDMIWDCGSLVGAGRGSSCAALNHYLLGITQLDPIEWNLPFFRYMNDERIELGDIDIDICPSKKGIIVNEIKKERGSRFNPDIDQLSRDNLGCTLVATYGTEGTKSAILTACRGYRSEEFTDGIDNDEAQYLASLVPSERGFLWDINTVINGDSEKGRRPVDLFIKEVNQYPGLLDIIKGIEGLINKRSSHASGVILFDEDPYEFGAGFMRTPKGEVITQLDLHDAEASGLTKYDFLVTEVQDKLAQTIKFLQEDGCIEKDMTLREVYNKYFHPNVLPLDRQDIWDAIRDGKVINVFQFDSEVGSQAAKKIKPQTILELSDANGSTLALTHFTVNQRGQ